MIWTYDEKLTVFFNAHVRGTPLEKDYKKADKVFDYLQTKCNYRMSDSELHTMIDKVVFDYDVQVLLDDEIAVY